MTSDELYKLYASWTGSLHFWVVKHLGAQVNFEFFPAPDWKMAIYKGPLYEDSIGTVPMFLRPANAIKLTLPAPEDNPTQEMLEGTFRTLCLAAARVLGVRLDKAPLPEPKAPESKKHAFLEDAPKRDHAKNRKSDGKKGSGVLRLRKPRSPRKRRSASAGKDRDHGKKRAV